MQQSRLVNRICGRKQMYGELLALWCPEDGNREIPYEGNFSWAWSEGEETSQLQKPLTSKFGLIIICSYYHKVKLKHPKSQHHTGGKAKIQVTNLSLRLPWSLLVRFHDAWLCRLTTTSPSVRRIWPVCEVRHFRCWLRPLKKIGRCLHGCGQ